MQLTQDEVKTLSKLNSKFQDRCFEIAKIMKSLDYEFEYLSNWQLCDNEVCGEGDEHLGYGEYEHHYGSFSAEWLSLSDEEITKIVNERIKIKQDKKAEEKRKEEERIKEKELADLKRLKEKYPNEF